MSNESVLKGTVFVYEWPVRLWHWINALCILVLAGSGYFIGSPLPSVGGEASEHFLMGYIRFAHFAAAYIFAIGFLGRVYWALVGNKHAKQLFVPPIFRAQWWKEVVDEALWYAFLRKEPHKYVGHNPLAEFCMFFMFVLGCIFMICTGFAMYGEGLGMGSWADRMFGWVIPLLGRPHVWLGDPAAGPESGCAYLASCRHVADRGVRHPACVCRPARGSHVEADHAQRHHRWYTHLQGRPALINRH